ncbi:MAG: TonB-dependent receptor [Hyphomicrobiaceae bacterium]
MSTETQTQRCVWGVCIVTAMFCVLSPASLVGQTAVPQNNDEVSSEPKLESDPNEIQTPSKVEPVDTLDNQESDDTPETAQDETLPPIVVIIDSKPEDQPEPKVKRQTKKQPGVASSAQASNTETPSISGDNLVEQNDTVTVNARKRIDNPKDVPFGLIVKTGQELERTGANRVREVIRDVPNVNVTGFGDGRSTSFLVRGVGPLLDPLGPDDTTFVIFVDGVPQPLFAADVGFLDLQQVELLKGPQGTLFGRNTTAGALNITTRAPTNVPEFSLRGEVGSDGYFLNEAVASGPIIENLVAGRVALRFTGVDGFVPNLITGNDLGEQNVVSGRGTLRFTPSASTSVTLSLNGDRDDRTFPFFLLGSEPRFPIASLVHDPNSERRFVAGTLIFEHKSEAYSFKSTTGLTQLKTIDFFNDDTEGLTFAQITGLPSSAFSINDSFSFWNEKVQTVNQEILFSSQPGQYLSWVIGASYHRSQFYADYLNKNILFSGLNGRRLNDLKTDSFAGFGEITVPVGFGFNVTTGARLTRENKEYDLHFLGIGAPGTVDRYRDAGSLNYNFSTGRGSLTYEISPDSSAYITASRGYKSGGFPRFVNDAAFGLPTTPYASTKTWTYEAGYKYRPSNTSVYLDVGSFYNEINDEQLVAFDPSIFSFRPANIDVVTYGLEVAAGLPITNAITLTAAMGYTRAKLVNIDPTRALAGAVSGNRPTNVPEVTASIALNYRQLTSELGLGFNAVAFGNIGWEYVGDRPADVANSFFLNSYQIINGRAGIELSKGLQFYVFGKNILDETPRLSGVFVPPNVEAVVPSRGRIVGLGTKAAW